MLNVYRYNRDYFRCVFEIKFLGILGTNFVGARYRFVHDHFDAKRHSAEGGSAAVFRFRGDIYFIRFYGGDNTDRHSARSVGGRVL